ncbi:hypothetical protein OF83DRAFT_372387 [Amylostereum chailletii]|nr:hypothetical protein OF83DRAFT_372387 [Amylostereum chailletii]
MYIPGVPQNLPSRLTSQRATDTGRPRPRSQVRTLNSPSERDLPTDDDQSLSFPSLAPLGLPSADRPANFPVVRVCSSLVSDARSPPPEFDLPND